jgi:hypothetical protein
MISSATARAADLGGPACIHGHGPYGMTARADPARLVARWAQVVVTAFLC